MSITREEFLEQMLWEFLNNEEHALWLEQDGDGYNEPYSENWKCGCTENGDGSNWSGPSWVQTEKDMIDRPTLDDALHEWYNHINYERSLLW